MKLDECYKRIDKYMTSSDRYPRFVNVNNREDLNAVCSHYNVGAVTFISPEKFSKDDESISETAFLNYLSKETNPIFLTGITSAYQLLGKEKLNQMVNRIIAKTYKAKLVFICYQCSHLITISDTRANGRMYKIDGKLDTVPQLIFSNVILPNMMIFVDGIHKIAEYIEKNNVPKLYVKTKKTKENFKNSLFFIDMQGGAYEQLCELDTDITNLNETIGNQEQWNDLLNKVIQAKSFKQLVENEFVSVKSLELVFQNWNQFDDTKKFIYFAALKCYGMPKNSYFDMAVKISNRPDELIKNIYEAILEIEHNDARFVEYYEKRKSLIKSLGEQHIRVTEFCQWCLLKGKNAIYYLTNNTENEIHMLFKLFNDYHDEFEKSEILSALEKVYPELYIYLQPYFYKNDLLNRYFDEYKYLKVMNFISPEFLALMEEQAIKREYNAILPARWEVTEGMADDKTLVYFMDAMGVEYLSFILAKCKENNLLANVTVCHSEIPSLTCYNKDFIEVFRNAGAEFSHGESGYKKLDDLKHHGEEVFSDFCSESLPFYLVKELEMISQTIKDVTTKLTLGKYEKAILISDHGASRLSVIKKQELPYEMSVKGIHSGRCCPFSETDTQPECAIEGVDHWVLANYGRFKGGRPANVEVHGGATLEEVVVPIIEITPILEKYDFKITNLNKTVQFGRRKNPILKVFSNSKLREIKVVIPTLNETQVVTSKDEHNFEIELSHLKKEGTYQIEIYLNDSLMSDELVFKAKNTDCGMNDKFKL